MKDLNIKIFYRYKVPVNKKKPDLTINQKNIKGNKKLSSRSWFTYPSEASEVEKVPFINYDLMIKSDKITILFNNKPKKVLSERALNRIKEVSNK
jgi:hypothetical protein